MTNEKKVSKKPTYASLAELSKTSTHIRGVLVDNAKTDTLVYGLLLSLQDEVDRGATRKSLRKEIDEAIAIAHQQFDYLFFHDEQTEGGDE